MISLPVADAWYEICRLDETLFRIHEPHVVDFMQSNMFVVRGRNGCLLIDGGNGVVPLRPFLAAHGFEPTIVVASHAHADHIGALHEWPEVLIHSAEAKGLARLDPAVTLAGPDYNVFDMATLAIDDASLTGPMITALPHAGYAAADYHLTAPRTRPIEEGAVLDLGDRRFEVLHLPGHCPGQIGFWDAENRVLIGGDAIYEGGLIDTLPHSDRAAYRRTMERLLTLNPAVTHGGHGGPLSPSRFREEIDAYLATTR